MWPFKRKQLDIKSLPSLPDDQHKWSVAEAGLDSSPLIIRCNVSARDWVGSDLLPIKLGFAIPLNAPNEGGLPDPEENAQLAEIEETVVREVAARTPGVFALVLTTGVMREYVFYVPRDVDIEAIHRSIQSRVATHDVQCMAVVESDWASYSQFAPQ